MLKYSDVRKYFGCGTFTRNSHCCCDVTTCECKEVSWSYLYRSEATVCKTIYW